MTNTPGYALGDRGDQVTVYRAAVVARLQITTGATVYDGDVPDQVPTDSSGYILPYVVLWAGDGDALPETDLSGRLDMDSLRWDFQTTSVGPNPDIAARVAGVVRRALTNMPLGTHHVLPGPFSGQQPPVKDTTVQPARYYVPRFWRLDTM